MGLPIFQARTSAFSTIIYGNLIIWDLAQVIWLVIKRCRKFCSALKKLHEEFTICEKSSAKTLVHANLEILAMLKFLSFTGV